MATFGWDIGYYIQGYYFGNYKPSRWVLDRILDYVNDEAPYDTGNLIASSSIGDDLVVRYNTPYAQRQFYEHRYLSDWIDKAMNKHSGEIADICNKDVKEQIKEEFQKGL